MIDASKATEAAGQGANGKDDAEPTLHYVNPTLQSLAEAFPDSGEAVPDFDDEADQDQA